MDKNNVTASKPKVGGAVFRAPVGTTLPGNATDSLSSEFKSLGYISEDGVSNANSMNSAVIRDWGGDPVFATEEEKTDTFVFKMIEALNTEVLKAVYGDDNVSGNLSEGIATKVNSKPQKNYSWVFDMVLKDDVLRRVVLSAARVSNIDDIVYKKNEPISYGVTLTAFVDDANNTHYEYTKAVETQSANEETSKENSEE